jgi:hypothetical protein
MTAAGRSDAYQLALGRKAAAVLRANPPVLEDARQLLARWIKRGSYHCPEWEALLSRGDVDEIAAVLEDDGEEGQRLRSSMPFVGSPFFTHTEVKDTYEAIFKG